jgi:copper chaperone
MKTLKFKTNIHNDGCLATVTPFLNAEKSIHDWKVDIAHPDKVLTVIGTDADPQSVENAVAQAGYRAEMLQVYGSGGSAL